MIDIKPIARELRKSGIKAEVKVSSHGDYPALFFANGPVKTQVTFFAEEDSSEAYEGFLFESLFPNPIQLDEVDANDWNIEYYYSTMAITGEVINFSRMYPIPASENSMELLSKLIDHWLMMHPNMMHVVLGKN